MSMSIPSRVRYSRRRLSGTAGSATPEPSIRAKRRKESSGTPIIHDRSSLHTLHSPNQDGIPSQSESSTRYTLGNTKGASHHWNTTRAVDEVSCHLVETGPHVRSHLAVLRHNHRDQSVSPCIDRKRGSVVPGEFVSSPPVPPLRYGTSTGKLIESAALRTELCTSTVLVRVR